MSNTQRPMSRREFGLTAAVAAGGAALAGEAKGKVFRAGAAAVDVMPKKWPVLVSGGFLERKAGRPAGTLHARCLVLDDGTTKVAFAVVDTLMMTREFCDEAKALASKATGIPTSHILISAVHTHSAPSVMGALGTGVQEDYVPVLRDGIAAGIEQAAENLAPAKVGWAVADAREHTNCRRWITRSDRIGGDPFGGRTVHAMMHPGYQNPSYVGPAGPIDPDLALLAVQSPDGKPIAVLANFSMHYFGAGAVSSDYFGIFCTKLAAMLGAEKLDPPFVGIMSQGTSGDLHWMDYSQPRKSVGIQAYAEALAKIAADAFKKAEYHAWAPLAASEKKLTLGRRTPDEKRLAWAKAIIEKMGDRPPKSRQEVYAKEAIYLHDEPRRELKLQAIRIGGLGITAIPCEVYGITGLKLKAQSPLQPTMNIELANGGDGYIPPPEQHVLGGYTTWPARTAGLEVQAEPKIVETVLACLEEASGRKRRSLTPPDGAYAKAVLASKPLAFWPLADCCGPRAADAAGAHHATCEDGVAFWLEGPDAPGIGRIQGASRAVQCAGGRIAAALKGLPAAYTVELWVWNGMPANARPVAGYLFSRGSDGTKGAPGDHLGIAGTHGAPGRLFFYNGDTLKEWVEGTTPLELRTWHHVALVRDGRRVSILLDGNPTLEVASEAAPGCPPDVGQVFLGGRSDGFAGLEGRICGAAIYPRALPADEIARHVAAARG